MRESEIFVGAYVIALGRVRKIKTIVKKDTGVEVSFEGKNPVIVSLDMLRPIPLSHEILAEICSYEEHLLGTGATEEVTYYIIDRLKIKHNTEDWRHEYFCVEGIPYELKWLHQLQQLFTIFEVEKEITLDGISVKEG